MEFLFLVTFAKKSGEMQINNIANDLIQPCKVVVKVYFYGFPHSADSFISTNESTIRVPVIVT